MCRLQKLQSTAIVEDLRDKQRAKKGPKLKKHKFAKFDRVACNCCGAKFGIVKVGTGEGRNELRTRATVLIRFHVRLTRNIRSNRRTELKSSFPMRIAWQFKGNAPWTIVACIYAAIWL